MSLIPLQYVWNQCLDCAGSLYSKQPPSPDYEKRVARILFGTGMHESAGFRYNRQRGFEFNSLRGAHGYWQQEPVAVRQCLVILSQNKVLKERAAVWYFQNIGVDSEWFVKIPFATLMQLTCADLRLSLMWARLYYMNEPTPIPESVLEQSRYWGRYYNTRNEQEKNDQWIAAYERGVAAIGGPGMLT